MKKLPLRKKETAGALEQRSCSLVGMAHCLLQTGGNFAVVVHGPVDCTNVCLRHVPRMAGAGPGRADFSSDHFFSSGLSDTDAALGRSEEKLKGCIEAAIDLCKPEIMFVLGTCLSEVIGDDVKKVSDEISRRRGLKIIAIPTSGLHLERQPDITDYFERTILQAAGRRGRSVKGSVAVAGLSLNRGEALELKQVCEAAGLKLIALLQDFAGLEHWRAALKSELVAVADARAHPSMIDLLQNSCGIECLAVPAPFGVSASRMFYRSILKKMGKARAFNRAVRPHLDKTEKTTGKAAEFLGGGTVAYEIGSALGFRAGQHAMEGLAHTGIFDELHMKVDILVQGIDSAGNRARMREILKTMEKTFRFIFFEDPGRLTGLLRAGGYDLAYCSDGRRELVLKAHTRFLALGSLRPLFGGMRRNAGMIRRCVESLFFNRYAKYL
jgi:nitrogenase molybdenum-iron protein alpha/beta subunit